MHIPAREELRAFSPESPEFAVLLAVKRLRTHGRPDWTNVRTAIESLKKQSKARPIQQVEFAAKARELISSLPGGAAQHLIHKVANEWGFGSTYIRAIGVKELRRLRVRNNEQFALFSLLPSTDEELFVITSVNDRNSRFLVY